MTTKTKQKTKIDTKLLEQIVTDEAVEKQVIIKCMFQNGSQEQLIRIWSTTFLTPREGGNRSKLLSADNITFFPAWTIIRSFETFQFTLIFEGLPKDCLVFDLIEEIPQSGGFSILGISRNQSDVYHVEV